MESNFRIFGPSEYSVFSNGPVADCSHEVLNGDGCNGCYANSVCLKDASHAPVRVTMTDEAF